MIPQDGDDQIVLAGEVPSCLGFEAAVNAAGGGKYQSLINAAMR